mgnify:CR=1 FL=1
MSKRDHQSIFLCSINDLMTSLAVVFILLLAVYANHAKAETVKFQKLIKELQTTAKGTFTIKEALKNKLKSQNIPFDNDDKDALALVYTAPDDKLQFDVDQAILHPSGKTYLNLFIPKIMNVLSEPSIATNIESILIEGHTDSDGEDEHNLKLSQERAFAVLTYSLNSCDLPHSQRDLFLNLTSINGRGERCLLPTGSREGNESKDESRRVLFKIRVKSVEQKTKDAQALTSAPAQLQTK